MDKLELKHVKGYLGTNLKGLIFYPHSDDETCTLKIKNGFNNECDINDFINGTYQIKPILHPLSDLTKEIEINREKFVPIEYFEIGEEGNNNFPFEFDYGNCKLIKTLINVSNYELNNDINYLPNAVVEKLYEWHFDIHGLIEKGLAIDINTIDNGIQ